ncbi:MAG: ABC transporter ATP-binding protein [Anaerolineae bacterium]|nr:ABC transporter ATP-binding protein [Anaerolineae bacterium]
MSAVFRSISYIRRYWGLALLAFFSLTAATVLALAVPQILRNVIDKGLPQPLLQALFTPRFLSEGLQVAFPRPQLIFTSAILLFGLSILRAIVAFGQRFFGERLSQFVSYDIRNDFYDKVQHLPFAYHDQFQMGQIITRAITDVDTIRAFIAQGMVDAINVCLILIGVIIAMMSLSVPLSLMALLPIPVIIAVAVRMGWLQIRHWLDIMEHMSGLSNLLEENVIGIQVLRAFNREQAEADHWARINQRLYHAQITFTETWSTYFPLMAFLVATSTAIMLWQGGPQVINHTLSIGTIIALNGYILLLAIPVQRLGFVVQQLSSASISAKRIFDILDTPSVLTEKPQAIPLPLIKGVVRFEDVSLHYGDNGPEVLHHISFETKPGQIIGLVGPTGTGKTSIVNLIARFYDVTGGCVTIDGYDVRDVTLSSLRSQIGLVLQETLLFTASVRDNIAFGKPDATDEEVIAAAIAADAHRFIMEMPEGYNTEIGERGATLSGGQRQRIAIARALLIQPKILILDDATSSVDTRTENAIQEALAPIMQDRLTFIIAQRLSSIRNADMILVIDHGQIVQRGTHDELIQQPGMYQAIYHVQMEEQERARVQMQAIERAEQSVQLRKSWNKR